MDGDTPICYFIDDINNYRTDRKDITDEERRKGPEFKWVSFLPDLSVGQITEAHKAGIFSFRFAIHDSEKNGDANFHKQMNWSKSIPKRSTPIRIRALIYMCRDLPSADFDGVSDPFITIWDVVEKEKKTKVMNNTTNPLFYEVLDLELEVEDYDDLLSYPPIIVDCYDYDDDFTKNDPDFMGRALIEPEDCALIFQSDFENNYDLEDSVFVKPRWHPFYFAKGQPKCGEVLISFIVTEYDFNYKHKSDQMNI